MPRDVSSLREAIVQHIESADAAGFERSIKELSKVDPRHPLNLMFRVRFARRNQSDQAAFSTLQEHLDTVRYTNALGAFIVSFCIAAKLGHEIPSLIERLESHHGIDTSLLRLMYACYSGKVENIAELEAEATNAIGQLPLLQAWLVASAGVQGDIEKTRQRLASFFDSGLRVDLLDRPLRTWKSGLSGDDIIGLLAPHRDSFKDHVPMLLALARRLMKGVPSTALAYCDLALQTAEKNGASQESIILLKADILLRMGQTDAAIKAVTGVLAGFVPLGLQAGTVNLLYKLLASAHPDLGLSTLVGAISVFKGAESSKIWAEFVEGKPSSKMVAAYCDAADSGHFDKKAFRSALAACIYNNDIKGARTIIDTTLSKFRLNVGQYIHIWRVADGFSDPDFNAEVA